MITEEEREPPLVPWLQRALDAPLWGALAFTVPFVVYVFSLPPGVQFWDTAEMQTVPYIFGITHPTGFPAFVILGWLFSHLLPVGTIAWRIGVLSATAMALAAYFAYRAVLEFGESRALAGGAALVFAFGVVAWSRGARAEVHALALAACCAVIWLLLRWRASGTSRDVIAAAFAYGVALATHGIALLILPGMALLLFPGARGIALRVWALAAAAVIGPCLTYLYIPLRSMYLFAHRVDPTLALGLPAGRPFWDFDHPATPGALVGYFLGGEGTQVGTGFLGLLTLPKYPRVAASFGHAVLNEYGFLVCALAAIGVAVLARHRPYTAAALFVAVAFSIPYALLYPEADQERYLLIPLWGTAVFAALGAAQGLRAYLNRRGSLIEGASAAGMLAAAVLLFALNAGIFGQRADRGADHYVDRLLAVTEPNAILIATWAYATPLGYAAFVEDRLGDRIVVTAQPEDYRSYFDQWLRARPIYVITDRPGPIEGFRLSRVRAWPYVARVRLK